MQTDSAHSQTRFSVLFHKRATNPSNRRSNDHAACTCVDKITVGAISRRLVGRLARTVTVLDMPNHVIPTTKRLVAAAAVVPHVGVVNHSTVLVQLASVGEVFLARNAHQRSLRRAVGGARILVARRRCARADLPRQDFLEVAVPEAVKSAGFVVPGFCFIGRKKRLLFDRIDC